MEGLECSGGPVRAKKEPMWHDAAALPPGSPHVTLLREFAAETRARANSAVYFARRSGAPTTATHFNITSGGPGASRGHPISSAVYFARTGISALPLKFSNTVHLPAGCRAARHALAVALRPSHRARTEPAQSPPRARYRARYRAHYENRGVCRASTK